MVPKKLKRSQPGISTSTFEHQTSGFRPRTLQAKNKFQQGTQGGLLAKSEKEQALNALLRTASAPLLDIEQQLAADQQQDKNFLQQQRSRSLDESTLNQQSSLLRSTKPAILNIASHLLPSSVMTRP